MHIKVMGEGLLRDLVIELLHRYEHEVVDLLPCDLLILANYTKFLPKEEVEAPYLGTLCFHPSLLPRHRGPDAVYWTLKMGETETGVTWFWPTERLDAGPIAIQRACPIPAAVSPGRLYYGTLVPLGVQLLEELLPLLLQGEKPMNLQDESKATYEPRRPKYSNEVPF